MGYRKLEIPKCRVGELKEPERTIMMNLIELFCDTYGFYEYLRLPKEATETALMQLIDTGMLKVFSDGNEFWLEAYNVDTESYETKGEI